MNQTVRLDSKNERKKKTFSLPSLHHREGKIFQVDEGINFVEGKVLHLKTFFRHLPISPDKVKSKVFLAYESFLPGSDGLLNQAAPRQHLARHLARGGSQRENENNGDTEKLFLAILEMRMKKNFYCARCPQKCYSFDSNSDKKHFFILSVSMLPFSMNFISQALFCFGFQWFMLFFPLLFLLFFLSPRNVPFIAIKNGQSISVSSFCICSTFLFSLLVFVFKKRSFKDAMKLCSVMFIFTRCAPRKQ